VIAGQKFFQFTVDNSKLHPILADANNNTISAGADGKCRKQVAYGLGAAGRFASEESSLVPMRKIRQRLVSIRAKAIEKVRGERK